ncbi:MAG: hypothetical protein ABI862_01255 [Ilumatobacteraceae bacterium]
MDGLLSLAAVLTFSCGTLPVSPVGQAVCSGVDRDRRLVVFWAMCGVNRSALAFNNFPSTKK